jgi:hypothetical protein
MCLNQVTQHTWASKKRAQAAYLGLVYIFIFFLEKKTNDGLSTTADDMSSLTQNLAITELARKSRKVIFL